MTQLIHQTGDIFTTSSLGIGHGVNVLGVMGHGIAVQFKNRFPEMYGQYRDLCKRGEFTPGHTMIYTIVGKDGAPNRFVYNISSQERPGPDASIEWLAAGVQASLEHAAEVGLDKIALPRIGSGIGGLSPKEVELVLKTLAEASPVDIELWTLPID